MSLKNTVFRSLPLSGQLTSKTVLASRI